MDVICQIFIDVAGSLGSWTLIFSFRTHDMTILTKHKCRRNMDEHYNTRVQQFNSTHVLQLYQLTTKLY